MTEALATLRPSPDTATSRDAGLVEAIEGLMHWRLPHDDAFTVTEGSRRAFRKLEAALDAAHKGEPA